MKKYIKPFMYYEFSPESKYAICASSDPNELVTEEKDYGDLTEEW